MAKAHSEFVISCFVISSRWDELDETQHRCFYEQSVVRFGADVIRQTVNELVNAGRLFNVIEYCRDQLPPV